MTEAIKPALGGHTLVVAEADGTSIEEFAATGAAAGKKAGEQFEREYLNQNKNPLEFMGAVLPAMAEAAKEMRASGATDDRIKAWSLAFMRALDPYTAPCLAAVKNFKE
jgi:hypothetical protein